MDPECEIDIVGIRPGEKLHEVMITLDDARHTVEFDDYYTIVPEFSWWGSKVQTGDKVSEGFVYSSETNTAWLTVSELKKMIEEQSV